MSATCPECAGPHLYSFTFRHRVDCGLYAADSATAAADHERRRGFRPATPTEQEFIHALALEYESPAGDERLYIEFSHDGIHWREPFIGPEGIDDARDARPAKRAGDDEPEH